MEVQTGKLLLTQQDRDRLIALKKASKGLITQRQAAEEIGQTERHIRRLLRKLKCQGDQGVIHALRGLPSNRKIDEEIKTKAMGILGQPIYHGFGPTLASEYLSKDHQITVSRETVRSWMIEGLLWQPKKERVKAIHVWRERRPRCGELVQWDTSDHEWLEGRGPRIYLINMIDDATSRIHARFSLHDSTEENMRLLWSYLESYGRPVNFYTDKASLFQTAPKIARDSKELARDERDALPPTQVGRALAELGIVWIAAHSPQAKGRVERSFQTAQDRLVKDGLSTLAPGLRLAGARTLEQANAYLKEEYIPWWNKTLVVVPASKDDAHRPLAKNHSLAASLSYVDTRQVDNAYAIRFDNKIYQIARKDIRAGLRGAKVRIEVRLDGSLEVRFGSVYLEVSECFERPKAVPAVKKQKKASLAPRPKSQWMNNFKLTPPDKAALAPTPAAARQGSKKTIR